VIEKKPAFNRKASFFFCRGGSADRVLGDEMAGLGDEIAVLGD
jgi:hypothetical protein